MVWFAVLYSLTHHPYLHLLASGAGQVRWWRLSEGLYSLSIFFPHECIKKAKSMSPVKCSQQPVPMEVLGNWLHARDASEAFWTSQ